MGFDWNFLSQGPFQSTEEDYYATSPLSLSPLETEPAPYVAPTWDQSPLSNIFSTLAKDNQDRVAELTTDLSRFESERDSLYDSSEKDWRSVGSGVLGGIAAALAGGSMADIATSASSQGLNYYNNLESQEKQKLAAAANKISETRNKIGAYEGLDRSLALNSLTQEAQFESQRLQGHIPGTAAYDQRRADDTSKYREQQDYASKKMVERQRELEDIRVKESEAPLLEAQDAELRKALGMPPRGEGEKLLTRGDQETADRTARVKLAQSRDEHVREMEKQRDAAFLPEGFTKANPNKLFDPATARKTATRLRYGTQALDAAAQLDKVLETYGSQALSPDLIEEARPLVSVILSNMAKMREAGAALTTPEINLYLDPFVPKIPGTATYTIGKDALMRFLQQNPLSGFRAASASLGREIARDSISGNMISPQLTPFYTQLSDEDIKAFGITREGLSARVAPPEAQDLVSAIDQEIAALKAKVGQR